MRQLIPRADRVAVAVPVRYRTAGDEEWVQGRSINMSESGLIFEPTELSPGARIDVIFALSMPIGAMLSGKLLCSAHVVRTTTAGATGARFAERRFLLEP